MDTRTMKRPLSSIESSTIPQQSQNVDVKVNDVANEGVASVDDRREKRPREENMFDEVISDPGLRKALDEYDPSFRDDVRREYMIRGPCQPLSYEFPLKNFGNTSRSFLSKWFEDYEWLEYSVSKDATFCFWCFLFGGETKHRNLNDAFVKKGFSNWKKGPQMFREHVGSVGSLHNEARILFTNFKHQSQSLRRCVPGVNAALNAQYRTRLTFSLDVARFLLVQGLPFRDHGESIDSTSRDLFKEMHNWCGKSIVEVENVVNESVQFTSHRIQDDLKIACGTMTRKAIISDLGDKVFSLLIDETRDSSTREQMTIVIRYVNNKGAVIERFLGVVQVVDTKARSLKKGIDDFFAEHGLSISNLRAQGYCGVSNMRGEVNGLKDLIVDENPTARYVHYFTHQLQLVFVAVSKDIQPVEGFFGYLSQITNMVGASCKRKDESQQIEHGKMVKMLEKGEISTGRGLNQECDLTRPGTTCSGSHCSTITRVLLLWSTTIQVLENIYEDGGSDANRGMAGDLVEKMESYEFIFIAHLMKQVLGMTNALSQFLEKKDQDLLEAVDLVRSCKKYFQDFKNGGWDELLEDVNAFCDKNKIDIPKMDDNFQGRFSARGVGCVLTNYDYFQVDIFCQVIDLIDQEIENRFSESNTELLACIGCLDPKNSFSKFSMPKLLRLAQFYPQDFSGFDLMVLKDELSTWIYYVREGDRYSKLQNIGEVAMKMVEVDIHTIFPLVYLLLELVLVLPIATATTERAFSAMKTVKSELRNKIADDNLTDSLVCYIEKDIFMKVDNEDILRYYHSISNRKKLWY